VAPPQTLTFKATVCVIPPPEAIIVIADVPGAAEASAVTVKAEVPEPGAGTVAGLKAAFKPDGPDAESDTSALKPLPSVMERLALLEPPGVTATD
jgi:hypothetical protein